MFCSMRLVCALVAAVCAATVPLAKAEAGSSSLRSAVAGRGGANPFGSGKADPHGHKNIPQWAKGLAKYAAEKKAEVRSAKAAEQAVPPTAATAAHAKTNGTVTGNKTATEEKHARDEFPRA